MEQNKNKNGMQNKSNTQNCRPSNSQFKNQDGYDDDNTPEIDTKNLTPGEVDERERKDGPGGN